MELDKICKELDDLAVHYFQILDDLLERKRKLELLLKEGYFNLSKARYSMGNKAVGTLQYDSNIMKALVDVNIGEEDDTSVFELTRHKPQPRQSSQSGTDSSEQQQEPEGSMQTGNKVRRRKVKLEAPRDSGNIQSTEDSIVLEEEHEEIKLKERKKSGEKEEEASLVDPLHWFGILVPSALRQGQTNFVQAVELSVRIASLQNQLMSLQQKYKALYQTKKKLKLEHDKMEQKDSNVEELTSNMNGVCVSDEADHI